MFSFKVGDIIVKWYSSTHTFQARGSGYAILREKLGNLSSSSIELWHSAMPARGLKRVNCGGLFLQLFAEPAVCNPVAKCAKYKLQPANLINTCISYRDYSKFDTPKFRNDLANSEAVRWSWKFVEYLGKYGSFCSWPRRSAKDKARSSEKASPWLTRDITALMSRETELN